MLRSCTYSIGRFEPSTSPYNWLLAVTHQLVFSGEVLAEHGLVVGFTDDWRETSGIARRGSIAGFC